MIQNIIIKKKIYKSIFFLFQNEFNYLENLQSFFLEIGFFNKKLKSKNINLYLNTIFIKNNLNKIKLIKNKNKILKNNYKLNVQILSFTNLKFYNYFLKFLFKIIYGFIFG